MKFMMVFEAVDRATRVMGKVMGAEKKTAAAMKAGARASQSATGASTRATQRLAAALSRVGGAARGAFAAVVAGASAAQRAIAELHRKIVALGRAGAGKVKEGAGKVVRGVAVAAGTAASAVGAAVLAANQLLGVATKFESYNIQMETLEGSSEKGQKAMVWVSDFAARTPLELDQVVEAYRNLKTFGLDPTDGTLLALVDTMAASGKGAEQLEGLTLALGQAWTKGKLQGEEALQLLERGVPVWDILSEKYGKTAAELQDLASKGKLGREAIRLLIEEIGRRNAGASDRMARTWEGMVSNLSDNWTRFALAIMSAGLFDWMKGKLQMVLDTVNKMAADGTLQVWAARVSARIIRVLEATWNFARRTYAILSRLGAYLAVAADCVGGWENLAMILAGFAFASTLIGTAAGLVQIAAGLAMLGAALAGLSVTGPLVAIGSAFMKLVAVMKVAGAAMAANPLMLIIMALVGAAALIYIYWGPIKAFFVNTWNAIAAGASAAWGKIKQWLGFDPVAALAAGWNSLSNLLADVWNSLPPMTWDGLLTVLKWASWLSPLRWLEFIPGFSWSGIISGALDWAAYIVRFEWKTYLPPLSWAGVLTVLEWASWLSPLRWLEFIPGFSWSGIISGVLDWASWLSPIRWFDFLGGFEWPSLPAFVWPTLPDIKWPDLSGLAGMVAKEWDNLKAFLSWSPADTIKAAWAGISELVGDLIGGVVSSAGAAWDGVKSIFSFSDEPAIDVADPATIRAAAEATAALKADMQAVAAIETRPALDRLAALETAAQRVGAAVTSSIRQAQAFLANVSFYDQGVALMDTMAAGIRARASVVTAEIAKMAQAARDHLPSSPAKVGPLSDIHRLKFAETIAASIRPAPMVKAMRQAAAATLAAATLPMPALPMPMLPAGLSLPMLPASAALAQDAGQDRAVAARAAIARVSVQGRPAEPAAASPVTLNFRPVLNFQGGAPAADVKAEFDRMLRGAGRELGKLLDEETRRRRRSEV